MEVLSHFYLSFTSKNKRVLIENVENLTIFCFLLEGNGILGTLIYITSNFKDLKYHIYLTQGFHGMQKVIIFAFSK